MQGAYVGNNKEKNNSETFLNKRLHFDSFFLWVASDFF